LKVYWKTAAVSGWPGFIPSKHTFKTLTAGTLLKRLLVAVVRNMPWELSDRAQGMNLEFTMQSGQALVSLLAGRIPQLSSDLALGEDRGILGEFMLLRTRRS
jgi:hypothetical protein